MGIIVRGDCLERLRDLEPNSVDSIVTDPPYGLSFMGKKWDYDVPSVAIWREVFRVLKPGGHLLSFGGTRTYHRLASAIEDAGFEIRDQIQWLYGSGFPKSLDVSKAMDKAAGAEREVVGQITKTQSFGLETNNCFGDDIDRGGVMKLTAPSTPLAKQWQGWGTALKPANEPICLARKPLEGTVASNVEKWGCGALNIDASRIATEDNLNGGAYSSGEVTGLYELGHERLHGQYTQPQGRWPANLILDEEAAAMLDEQSGTRRSAGDYPSQSQGTGQGTTYLPVKPQGPLYSDSGAASRFFYCAKASKSERNAGLEGMPERKFEAVIGSTNNQLKRMQDGEITGERHNAPQANHHPTVKPLKLMEYLIRLITPPNGTVLDPFAGSGSTLVAAKRLGFKFIGIELSDEYAEIAERRVANVLGS